MHPHWEDILKEVLNRQLLKSTFDWPSHKKSPHKQIRESKQAHYTTENPPKQPPTTRYYLPSKAHKSIYLTPRETDCVIYLLQGNTMRKTAKILGLSNRTVEFYMAKIKKKFACRSKAELIKQLIEMDFNPKHFVMIHPTTKTEKLS